jgi:hypothetical protein
VAGDQPNHWGRKDLAVVYTTNDGKTSPANPEVLEWYHGQRDLFPGKKAIKSETEADLICPGHDDHSPSLGFDLSENGRGPKILVRCRSQECELDEILHAVGLEKKDLFYRNGSEARPEYGLTLEEYAAHKRLPVEFLKGELGLRDEKYYVPEVGSKVPAVRIPYPDRRGDEVQARHRVSLAAEKKVLSEKGVPTILYGMLCLKDAIQKKYALLLEGESDCHTAWKYGIPAIGVPGAGTWKDEWDELLDGIEEIFVVVEPGKAGEKLWDRLKGRARLHGRLRRIG